jgi:hypothetical protein
MSEHTTRIADLPENITMEMPRATAPGYAPINVHPNPYGNTAPQDNPPPPQMRLPSRDIPMDPTIYQNDEEVQPNYIPKVKLNGDYVKQYEDLTESNIRGHEASKKRYSKIDYIITTLQVPITISLLFFFFQMPMVNAMFFKNFAFMSVYNSDGNINFYGIALKSALFGTLFYVLQNSIDYLSDI